MIEFAANILRTSTVSVICILFAMNCQPLTPESQPKALKIRIFA